MRIAIRFLLLISFLTGLLYYSWLTFALLLSRTHAKNAIATLSGEQSSQLRKIPVAALDEDESDEVWFNGNLYDVVKRESIHDTGYVFVIQDSDEQEALDNISGHYQTENFFLQGRENKVCLPAIKFQSSDQENFLKSPGGLYTALFLAASTASREWALPAFAAEVNTPPPKKS